MTILFANLGTSDISVKIDGYYIPCVNRDEPNMVSPDPKNVAKVQTWENSPTLISDYFEQNFQIISPKQRSENPNKRPKIKINFREITKALAGNYDQLANIIRIDRILGVIKKSAEISKAFAPDQSLKIYLFLTDQSPVDLLDTLYAYSIVEKYLNNLPQDYLVSDWELNKIIIPQDIPVAQQDEDKILNFYLEKVSEFYQKQELVLFSIRGGTPFMQTGLRLTAFAMGLRQQVFIEPQLNAERVLMGEPSECRLISYWRSQKQRELQTIKKLLERWDFDGVRVILGDWRKNLKSLQTIDLPDSDKLSESLGIVDAMERETQMALDCWQLDFGDARSKAAGLANEEKRDQYLELIGEPSVSQLTPNQLLLFNLYAQSKISFECNEIVRFIYGFSTFHEVSQLESIVKLSPADSLQEGDWGYNLVFEHWSRSQKENMKKELRKKLEKRLDISEKEAEAEVKKFHCFIPLKNRIIRSCVIGALTNALTNPENKKFSTIEFFNNLDFWYDKRNKLVHAGDGISQERIITLHLERDQEKYKEASRYDSIIVKMQKILIRLYGESLFKSKNLDGYFIYDQVRDSINNLMGLL